MKNYFNPRSYKRSDESASHFWHKVIISIHAPTRGATQFLWMHLLVHLFQSTLLQEERPQDNMVMQIGKMISIHAPTRGATCQPYTPSHSCLISIHAPTRGATLLFDHQLHYKYISIHAPTRGATFGYTHPQVFSQFQSTLLQEERPKLPCTKGFHALFQSTLLQEERRRR